MPDPQKPVPGNPLQAETLEKQREHLDELLDEALKESFPASDPSSIAVDGKK